LSRFAMENDSVALLDFLARLIKESH